MNGTSRLKALASCGLGHNFFLGTGLAPARWGTCEIVKEERNVLTSVGSLTKVGHSMFILNGNKAKATGREVLLVNCPGFFLKA